MCDCYCRYKTISSSPLDQCNFCDPQLKLLVHLSESRRASVQARIESSLEIENDIEVCYEGASTSTSTNAALSEGPKSKSPSKGLLSTLLGNFKSQTNSPAPTQAETEINQYLSEPPCPMNACPLKW